MYRPHLLAALGAVLAFAVACDPAPAPSVTPASPSASPSEDARATAPTASIAPSGSPTAFTSQRFPYTFELPAEWTARDAEPLASNDPGIDIFDSPDQASGMYVSSSRAPLPEGTTLQEAMDMIRLPAEDCEEVEAQEEIEVGGEPAIITGYECTEGQRYVIAALTIHEGTGYLVYWDSKTGTAEPDRATFVEVLETVAFTD